MYIIVRMIFGTDKTMLRVKKPRISRLEKLRNSIDMGKYCEIYYLKIHSYIFCCSEFIVAERGTTKLYNAGGVALKGLRPLS